MFLGFSHAAGRFGRYVYVRVMFTSYAYFKCIYNTDNYQYIINYHHKPHQLITNNNSQIPFLRVSYVAFPTQICPSLSEFSLQISSENPPDVPSTIKCPFSLPNVRLCLCCPKISACDVTARFTSHPHMLNTRLPASLTRNLSGNIYSRLFGE